MDGRRVRRGGAAVWNGLPGLLLLLFSLLTVVWLSPDLPYPQQDSAWVLAVNQAVADRLAFGRDIIYPIGPWGAVYAGQYHPATDGMMLFGGALVALALAGGLWVLAEGGRRWALLLAPLIVATVGQRDPVFVVIPLLLLSVAVAAARPARLPDPWPPAALLLLTPACALLTLVKGSFGTQAIPMTGLAILAMLLGRRFRLAILLLALYTVALASFWLGAGQRLADLPAYVGTMSAVIAGYAEGLALGGPVSHIVAYLCCATLFLWLFWRDRTHEDRGGTVLLALGLLLTLFLAFKSGFTRHDEHALIAAGTLAMVPVILSGALRARSLAAAVFASLSALVFISHHYAGYEWPSFARGHGRLAMAASGAWTRLVDPGRLPRLFDIYMAAVRTGMPLPRVTGPTDIYSSGQMILLASGLEWSPRPAIQSVTVLGDLLMRADLDHLQGTDGRRPPVENVFYRVENEDNRLRSTMDGLSWPTLLSAFRAVSYDRALDTALLRRMPGAAPAVPGPTLVEGQHGLNEEVALPSMPGGMAWATLEIEPTLAGRLASLLFRPPLLTISIRYASGPVEQFRLVSALARSGFMLTPRVLNTEDMLSLLLPERRAPGFRPLSISITGQSGTGWLWQPQYALRLRAIDIPVQEQVRAMLAPASLAPLSTPVQEAGAAELCAIELVDGRHPPAGPITVGGTAEVSGWSVISVARGQAPERVVIRLADRVGRAWETVAETRPRLDVAGYFVNPALSQAGFAARFDLSTLAGGPYRATILAERDKAAWRCSQGLDLIVAPPGPDVPD